MSVDDLKGRAGRLLGDEADAFLERLQCLCAPPPEPRRGFFPPPTCKDQRPPFVATLRDILGRLADIRGEHRRQQYARRALAFVAHGDDAKPAKRKLPRAIIKEFRVALSAFRSRKDVRSILANAARAYDPEAWLRGALRNVRSDSRSKRGRNA